METSSKHFRYIAWKSPEEMHFSSLQWASELKFIQDEHHFFQDMLKEYTLPIIESHLLDEVRKMIDRLNDSKTKGLDLLQRIEKHINGLDIMVDGVDQPDEEKDYKEEHKSLLKELNEYSRAYNKLKKEIFEIVSKALKKQKQKRLLE
ncbi:hypothetical protein [Salegentibacter chungangensis]|uniref:Uncharacterized protein n=1 Tax=Salegentibacter chungangensis TaxID=1335724 RepID=A0ABW3NUS0_9FLAO